MKLIRSNRVGASRQAVAGAQLGCALGLIGFLAAGLPAAPAGRQGVDFERDVRPIFAEHCDRCHGARKQRSGLRLDVRSSVLEGGDSGKPAVVPGTSAESHLIERVTDPDEDLRMPPKGDRLSPEQVAVLRKWIDAGAAYPAESKAKEKTQITSDHWAFQPVTRPTLPAVTNPDWVRNGIDAFILARLEREKLSPSPEAGRATLLRRVTLDLTGLPPTPAEMDAFLSDTRLDAYERAVDRLLTSPHFGEKWARWWLDLARYADSDGYLTDQIRPWAWRYRDWVVSALNRDMPFDRFSIEQLAGDTLPDATVDQLVATGFHRNTLSNREGGADLEEFRVAKVVDRTITTGTVWLGLTLECSRCHDHKYDPIRQRDFYEFYAFFNNAGEVNIDAPLPGQRAAQEAAKPAYDARRRAILAPVADEIAKLQARWEEKLLHAAEHPGESYPWDRAWEVLGLVWGAFEGQGQLEGQRIIRKPPAERLRRLLREMLFERLATLGLARITLDFDGSVQSTRRHAEGTAVGYNKKRKGPIQLDLFVPHEYGYEFKVIVTNKTLQAGRIVAFHEGRGAQEGVLGELKSHCQMGYVPVRGLRLGQTHVPGHRLPTDAQLPADPPERPALRPQRQNRVNLRHPELVGHRDPPFSERSQQPTAAPQDGRFSPAPYWPLLRAP